MLFHMQQAAVCPCGCSACSSSSCHYCCYSSRCCCCCCCGVSGPVFMFLHDVSVVAAAAAVSKSVLLKLSLKSSWQFFRHEAHAAFLLLYENLMTFLSCHQWWLPGQARPGAGQTGTRTRLDSTRLDSCCSRIFAHCISNCRLSLPLALEQPLHPCPGPVC